MMILQFGKQRLIAYAWAFEASITKYCGSRIILTNWDMIFNLLKKIKIIIFLFGTGEHKSNWPEFSIDVTNTKYKQWETKFISINVPSQ